MRGSVKFFDAEYVKMRLLKKANNLLFLMKIFLIIAGISAGGGDMNP